MITSELQSFFKRYLQCWDRGDYKGIADLYTIPAAIYGATGPETFTTRKDLVEKMRLYCDYMAAIEYQSADLNYNHVMPLGEGAAFVDLTCTVYRKNDVPFIFNSAYILHLDNRQWKIFCSRPYDHFDGVV